MRDNEQFNVEEIELISAQLEGSDIDVELPKVGRRFGDWEIDQCGKLGLPDPDDEIPIPFAPVMAGVLVAGEMFPMPIGAQKKDSRLFNASP